MTSLANKLAIQFNARDAFAPLKTPIATKIICTIGPKTNNVKTLVALIKAGMNVARLNFSHGTHEYHQSVIDNVREAIKQTGSTCAIMLDTKGPEIRTGKLVDGKDLKLEAGDSIVLTTDYSVVGTKDRISHSYKSMSKTVQEGSEILIDDGLISLVVTKVLSDSEVECRILNGGMLGETKGVNLPAADVALPALTEKDKADLKFGCEQKVDLLAASFIRKGDDVVQIREYLKQHGGERIKIMSKVENQEGVQKFDEVLEASDAIMVARGDLGVEIPVELIATAQKMMIAKCNLAGKPVVTATQMLDSMIKNPRPTRAETTDVANAVLDGTDCVMLSGETAKGDYPVQTVKTMVNICRQAEKLVDHRANFDALNAEVVKGSISVDESISSSAVKTSLDVGAGAIVCHTKTGETARFICKYRPKAPVLCVTSDEITAHQLMISGGAVPILAAKNEDISNWMSSSECALKKTNITGLTKRGQLVVAVHGNSGDVEAAEMVNVAVNKTEV